MGQQRNPFLVLLVSFHEVVEIKGAEVFTRESVIPKRILLTLRFDTSQ